jgi:hypothetical protein
MGTSGKRRRRGDTPRLLTRREALGAMAGLAAWAGMAAAAAMPVRQCCSPVISRPLWWFNPQQTAEWGRAGWERELDEHRRPGFDLLWLANAPAGLDHEGDPLRMLLDLCGERTVQVILDTGSSGRWYAPLDLEAETALCRRNIQRLGERFAGHAAFHAWYVPHEIYMVWDERLRYVEALYPALVEACKSAAALPVTLSPFFILDRDKVFGDFRFNEPDEYRRFWARLIRRSGFDVIMLQDSGEHFSYVTDAQRKPFFEAMQAACREGGARFWGNVETAEFECPSIEEYVTRYGRVHHSTVKDAPWRPVPLPRLRGKLDLAARYCERIVTWGYREFCRPALGPAARGWYEAYRRYAAQVRSEAISHPSW